MTITLADIQARRDEIAREIERLRLEDEELAIAEQVLERLSGAEPRPRRPQPTPQAANAPRSQREFVLDALETSPEPWLKAKEIIAMARKRWAVVIPEKSLRPLLTMMKNQRLIERRGRLVAIRHRARSGAADPHRRASG
ncbi:MAG: hypothetical protein R3C30_09440 [Hyphomonadaceae bacterium]